MFLSSFHFQWASMEVNSYLCMLFTYIFTHSWYTCSWVSNNRDLQSVMDQRFCYNLIYGGFFIKKIKNLYKAIIIQLSRKQYSSQGETPFYEKINLDCSFRINEFPLIVLQRCLYLLMMTIVSIPLLLSTWEN